MARQYGGLRVGATLAAAGALALSGGQAHGLVVQGGLANIDEFTLQMTYTGFPYWENVGQVGDNGTGIYLGNGLVLSATHVNAQSKINLGGIEYGMSPVEINPADAGSDRGSLNNPSDVPGTLTAKSDIRLWRLNGGVELDLTPLPIVGDMAAVNREIAIIGTGVVTTEPFGPAPFDLGTERLKLWGNNKVVAVFDGVANSGDPLVPNLFGRQVIAFSMQFNSPGPTALAHEAQATPGDSGAPVFVVEGGVWKLAGLLHSVTGTSGQVAYNDRSFISDLSFYDDQINRFLFKAGDFDQDFSIGAADIDALFAAIGSENPDAGFDLNNDMSVDQFDADFLVQSILGTQYGDANLDGRVDGDDFRVLKTHLNLSGGWAMGDFNGDGVIDVLDYGLFRSNFGFGIEAGEVGSAPMLVPEPAAAAVMLLGLGGLAMRRRR